MLTFFAGLPMQSAEAVLRKSVQDFNNWLASLKKYRANPKGYTGRPKMPGYLKGERATFTITNQDAVYYDGYLKLPLTKTRLCLPNIPKGGVLKEVKIKPYYDNYLILCTFEVKDIVKNNKNKHVASIDFGVNNIAALVTDEGHSFLYKGDVIKSCNQGFNKKRSELVSILTKGHTNAKASSKRLIKLSRKRDSFINDQLHKISKDIIDNCIKLKIGTIILGVNKGMKQNSDMGKVNNQNFVNIPISRLMFMITYKAERVGITVIEQEESYTSKADFLSKDYIPMYSVDDELAVFSGTRIKRGLYKSAKGTFVNADLNAAANIMRKAGIKAKIGVKVLQNPIMCTFKTQNKSIPVKGIVATL